MRRGGRLRLLLVAAACALLVPLAASAPPPKLGSPAQVGPSGQPYPNTSWALGIVVPEGATMQDGGKLRWEGASNVTVVLTLPNISLPDRTVYAVLSVMTSDGTVLQAAAGIQAGSRSWLAYSWLIPNAQAIPLTYDWVLNGSAPDMNPGAKVALSIYYALGSWNLKVADESTGTSESCAFPSGPAPGLKAGDQEVFAVESYSRLAATFRCMGNLTLSRLLVGGTGVTGGFYSYGDWDPSHNPLFVVGSSGTSPPAFVSVQPAEGGSVTWGYTTVWGIRGDPMANVLATAALILLATASVLGVVLWKTRKRV